MKKITSIALLFIIIFSNTVFAKSFPTMNNVSPHKVWTIKFNKDIKSDVKLSIKNERNEYVTIMVDVVDNEITITSLLDYLEGEYLLTIDMVTGKDNSILKEPVNMKFIVKK